MINKHLLNKTLFVSLVFSMLILLGFPLLFMTSKTQGVLDVRESIYILLKPKQKEDVIFLYFGFVGCTTICEPSLTEISKIFTKNVSDKVGFYFINIANQETDAQSFAQSFNPRFNGLNLKHKELNQLMAELKVYSSAPLYDGGETSHSGHLYLIKKSSSDFILKKIYYTRPFNIKSIHSDIKKELT